MTLEELRDVFRANLKARRRELRLTQTEIGERLGMPQSYVAKLESGARVPSFELLARIAECLNTTPDVLLNAGAFASQKISA